MKVVSVRRQAVTWALKWRGGEGDEPYLKAPDQRHPRWTDHRREAHRLPSMAAAVACRGEHDWTSEEVAIVRLTRKSP